MTNPGRASQPSKPNHLRNLLRTEFDEAHPSYDLLDEFLQHETYSQSFCLRLLASARQSAGMPWSVRRLAVLMLEHQILKLSPDNVDEFDFLLTRLNLKPGLGLNINLVSSVLKEGYTTTELRRFIPEFRRKLERLNRVHGGIKGRRSSEIALRDFMEQSRRDCKLSLARYIFRPGEVVAQILKQLKVAEGVRDLDTSRPSYVDNEVKRAINALPDFEAEILKRLCETSNIYWVSEATSSEINSLVEYPLTTVVLVVKPPGSDIEFEIKRAGRRGPTPLSVVYARDGYTVPPSHRLDGGSMLWLLRYEAKVALRLSIIYRLAHGTEAPMSFYVATSNISSVPIRNSEVPILSYFTESSNFGKGFREMRVAMKESVAAFKGEGYTNLPVPPGDLGLTAQFIAQAAPAQTILNGTSSFRLDKLALYLSGQGPERYFKDGLNVSYSKHDARRLADEILEEILGVYQPPRVRYQSYKQYLEAAFSVAENRARADQTYLSLVQQIGRFWGTLVAVRGFARGESFVARNVGLKNVWENGQWRVKLIFMDHDALTIPGPQTEIFYAHGAIPHMDLDEKYIWGRSSPHQFAVSEGGYLQNIYRISDDLKAKGQALADRAMKESYTKTQDGILNSPELRRLFDGKFVERLTDWDTVVRGYFEMRRNPSASAAWKKAMRKMLDDKGHKQGTLDSYIEIIQNNLEFIERYSFLFNSDTSS